MGQKEQFIGTWRLTNFFIRKINGAHLYPFGKKPNGKDRALRLYAGRAPGALPLKKRRFQFRLQLADGTAQSRLGDMKRRSCLREMADMCHRAKIDELGKLHKLCLLCNRVMSFMQYFLLSIGIIPEIMPFHNKYSENISFLSIYFSCMACIMPMQPFHWTEPPRLAILWKNDATGESSPEKRSQETR